jgi:hypothetical protein
VTLCTTNQQASGSADKSGKAEQRCTELTRSGLVSQCCIFRMGLRRSCHGWDRATLLIFAVGMASKWRPGCRLL